MDKNNFNILFTCSGRRVALIEAFRGAMKELGVSGKVVAADVTSASAAFQLADQGILVPLVEEEQYIPALLEHVRKLAIKLLVPVTDIDLLMLARHREQFEQIGCTVMIGSAEIINLCRDKARTNDLLASTGLPTIKTLSLREFLDDPFFPCFAKPVAGSAGVGGAVIHNHKDMMEHAEEYGERLIVQEYLGGREYTIDVYRSRDGVVRCVVPRQRLAVRSGEVEKGITVKDDALIASAVRVAEALDGLWGVFCCQCRCGAEDCAGPCEEPRFFEINPRFGGGAPLSIAAGANLPLYLLQEVLGLPITARLGQFTPNMLMLRYDSAAFVQADDPTALPGYGSPKFR